MSKLVRFSFKRRVRPAAIIMSTSAKLFAVLACRLRSSDRTVLHSRLRLVLDGGLRLPLLELLQLLLVRIDQE